MLAAKKKIAVRQAVPQSGVLAYWEKAKEFYGKYSKWILIGAVLVAAVIVAYYVYSSRQAAREAEAGSQLRKVQTLFQQQQYKLAIDGDPARGIPGLKSIVESYGGTTSGTTAAMMLGQSYLYTDQFELALAAFDDANPSNDLLKANALAGMAAAHEGLKNYAEAAKLYEKAADRHPNDLLKAGRYFAAARAWGLAGDKDKAADALRYVQEANTPRYEQDVKRLQSQLGIEDE